MSLKEDLDIFEPALDVQKAYDESARAVFDAAKLHPWTISRHSVAIALGCKLAIAVGPFIGEFLETGAYDNVFRDVVIVLYLSSLSDDAVLDLDSKLDVKSTMGVAYAWAEKHEITYGSKGFMSGVKMLDKILKNLMSSYFEVEGDGGEVKKKDIDAHGKSRLPDQPASPAELPPKRLFVRCLWRKLFSGKHSITATPGSKALSN